MRIRKVYEVIKQIIIPDTDEQFGDKNCGIFDTMEEAQKERDRIARIETIFNWQRIHEDNGMTIKFIASEPTNHITYYKIIPAILIEDLPEVVSINEHF